MEMPEGWNRTSQAVDEMNHFALQNQFQKELSDDLIFTLSLMKEMFEALQSYRPFSLRLETSQGLVLGKKDYHDTGPFNPAEDVLKKWENWK